MGANFHIRHHFGNKLLACGFLAVKQAQRRQQPSLARRVGLQRGLPVDVDEHDAQVAAAAALARLEQRLGDAREYVNGGGPVLRLDVPGGRDAGLLLRLVVVAVGNLLLQPGHDAVDLACHGVGGVFPSEYVEELSESLTSKVAGCG